jgi:hypothetical protein
MEAWVLTLCSMYDAEAKSVSKQIAKLAETDPEFNEVLVTSCSTIEMCGLKGEEAGWRYRFRSTRGSSSSPDPARDLPTFQSFVSCPCKSGSQPLGSKSLPSGENANVKKSPGPPKSQFMRPGQNHELVHRWERLDLRRKRAVAKKWHQKRGATRPKTFLEKEIAPTAPPPGVPYSATKRLDG